MQEQLLHTYLMWLLTLGRLSCRLLSVKHSLSTEQIHQLAQHTQGFVGADLAALVNEAALSALRRYVTALQRQELRSAQPIQQLQPGRDAGLCVCWQDFEAARLLVRPSALREVAVEVPQVRTDTGGRRAGGLA
jgi:SpoVK/Ycf46/Vps4 family AAA+-type ATPase